jgi:hypothetical protein
MFVIFITLGSTKFHHVTTSIYYTGSYMMEFCLQSFQLFRLKSGEYF